MLAQEVVQWHRGTYGPARCAASRTDGTLVLAAWEVASRVAEGKR